MGWLINTKTATSGDGNIRNLPPTLVLNLTADHVFLQQRLNQCPDIITNQEDLLPVVLIRRVYGQFFRWQAENEPVCARFNMGKLEHIPKESAIRRRVCAIDNGLCNGNQSIYYIYGTSR